MSQVDQIREDQSESITNLQNSDLITHEQVFPTFVLKYYNENFFAPTNQPFFFASIGPTCPQ